MSRSALRRQVEPTQSFPFFEMVFANEARGAVHVICGHDALESLAGVLIQLGYRQTERRRIRLTKDGKYDGAPAIVIVDAAIAGAVEFCGALPETTSRIVLCTNPSFEQRRQFVEAGVEAVVDRSINQSELIDWLDHFGGKLISEPASILVVDDDPLLSQVYATLLRSAGMIVEIVNQPSAIIQEIENKSFDLVLMDIQMPEVNGIDLARIIRLSRKHISVPIVFLSAEQNSDIQMAARRQGGDDFIPKKTDPDSLLDLIRLRVERARTLKALIDRDSLTGLLNHRRFVERVTHELHRTRRTRAEFCVALLDIDHFKRVNDTWGHQTGDQVLSSMSRALVSNLRGTDIIGRYGGEEFGVLLLDTQPESAEFVLDKFRNNFAQTTFDGPTEKFSVTLSGGVAGSRFLRDAPSLIAAADEALYKAKQSGRNQIVVDERKRRAP